MHAKSDNLHSVTVLMIDRHLGNLVVSLSSIVALAKHFRGRNFYVAMDGAYREVAESIRELDRIIYYPRTEMHQSHLLREAVLFLRFIHQIRTTHSDALIDLQGGTASSLVTLLSGASYRISNSAARRPYVYNEKIDLPAGEHKVRSYSEIAAALSVPIDDSYLSLHASESRRSSLKRSLKVHGITGEKPIVSIHAGAGNIHKQWTTDGFVEVADWLSARGFQVIFVGAGRDLDKIHAIMSGLNLKAYNFGGSISLGELMALFEMSSLFLGNDSGPMHLAAAIGIPVVALFGPVDEKRWRPLSPNATVLRGQEPCEDCRVRRQNCHHAPCITQLSPDKVKQAIEQLLQGADTESAQY